MRDATRIYYVVFGLLILIGGLWGYFRGRSLAALVSGMVCAILFFVAAFLMDHTLNGSLIVGLLVSISLAGKFIPDALHNKSFFPGRFMAVLSAVSVTLTLLSWYRK
jgi:uncharacterized membrane protein (UPF0136 family)